MRKVGGLYFWKIGRLGGSIYITKPKPLTWGQREDRAVNLGLAAIAIGTVVAALVA